jgi:hemerythrin superfamily protein
MDIFELLREDHREIDDLLTRLERPPGEADFDGSGRTYLRDRLVLVASRHEAAEEMVFWPDVRNRLADGADLADRALQQERDAKALLDLMRFANSEEEIVADCGRLHAAVRNHAEFEEQTVFPAMHRYSTPVWRSLAAMRFKAARKTGPTRPHPAGPDRPLRLMTIGAPTVLLDHLRDKSNRQRRQPTGFEEPERTDAIAVLTRDHSRIDKLLGDIEARRDPEDRLVREAIREISIHDSIERQYLYPLIRRRLENGEDRYQILIAEHGRIAGLAADIDAYRFHDDARRSWLRRLIIDVRTHIEQEEAGVLPALAARMTHEELVDLGYLLESSRGKAPTRPHRHLAGAGVGARLSRLMAAPIDKTRDKLSGRTSG